MPDPKELQEFKRLIGIAGSVPSALNETAIGRKQLTEMPGRSDSGHLDKLVAALKPKLTKALEDIEESLIDQAEALGMDPRDVDMTAEVNVTHGGPTGGTWARVDISMLHGSNRTKASFEVDV